VGRSAHGQPRPVERHLPAHGGEGGRGGIPPLGRRDVHLRAVRLRRGRRAGRAHRRALPQHAPGVPIHFERLAVTPKQIAEWGLPTRPAKKSDPQAAKRGRTPAVELDAINPNQLNKLIEDAIELHVDKRVWHLEREQEQRERQGLFDLRDGFRGAAKVLMAATKR
jgi:hypothetical protein